MGLCKSKLCCFFRVNENNNGIDENISNNNNDDSNDNKKINEQIEKDRIYSEKIQIDLYHLFSDHATVLSDADFEQQKIINNALDFGVPNILNGGEVLKNSS
jgi:hypothetical protein